MSKIKKISRLDVKKSLHLAQLSERGRHPILLNDSFSEKPQRFVNCLTSNTYIQPHMHIQDNQWELMAWLTGTVTAYIFDTEGFLLERANFDADNIRVFEIPPYTYHSFTTENEGSYLELRNCTYEPEHDRVYANWAAEEDTAEAAAFLQTLKVLRVGEKIGKYDER